MLFPPLLSGGIDSQLIPTTDKTSVAMIKDYNYYLELPHTQTSGPVAVLPENAISSTVLDIDSSTEIANRGRDLVHGSAAVDSYEDMRTVMRACSETTTRPGGSAAGPVPVCAGFSVALVPSGTSSKARPMRKATFRSGSGMKIVPDNADGRGGTASGTTRRTEYGVSYLKQFIALEGQTVDGKHSRAVTSRASGTDAAGLTRLEKMRLTPAEAELICTHIGCAAMSVVPKATKTDLRNEYSFWGVGVGVGIVRFGAMLLVSTPECDSLRAVPMF